MSVWLPPLRNVTVWLPPSGGRNRLRNVTVWLPPSGGRSRLGKLAVWLPPSGGRGTYGFPPRKCLLLLLLFVLAGAGQALASDRYDPRLRFRTIVTPNFEIHFHQGEDALARRLAAIAEAAADELAPTLGRPSGTVHVILVNQDDVSNGWATPVPFNVIEIAAASPRGSSSIGNTNDWLRLVFVHEYTHILHLDRSRGLFGGLRKVFGRNPALLPNIFVPPWQIEGIATFQESAITGEGRVYNGDFRHLLTRAAASERLASLDRASSLRTAWPSGNTPYLYGAYFHEYLSQKYGEPSLAKLADATAGRVPYFGSGAFKQVFNAPLGRLWEDFERESLRSAAVRPSSATRLTHHGFIVSAPAYAPDGRLFYSVSNPHGFPALMEWTDDGASRRITTRVGGGRIAAGGELVLFDQLEYVRSVGVQSDLYAVSTGSGDVRRLTREARAGDPDVSPDGRTIVCTIQEADRRFLATLPAGGHDVAPTPLISEPDTSYASPRWSPDGRLIVAERQRIGFPSELVVIDAASRAITATIDSQGRGVSPSWTPDGRAILFASDRQGGPFRIFAADLASGELRMLANAGDRAESPVVSPDGRTLVFVGDTSDGYDLFSLPWDRAEWQSVPTPSPSAPSSAGAHDGAQIASTAQTLTAPYRPGRQLLPRFWTPIIAVDNEETSFGLATAGSDALGRHAYAAGGAWSTAGRPDWYAVYIYDRWRARLFADTSASADPWLGGEVRTRELNAGASVPFRTFRRAQSMFASFHLSQERLACEPCVTPVDATVDRRALRGGWSFTSAKAYGYSISREDGITLSAAGELSPAAFGSTGTSTTVVFDARGFVPAFPRHGTVAVRGAAAGSWGDENAVRRFGAGGSASRPGGVSFGREAIALVRGFDADSVVGSRAAVVNADYRVPLAWIERGVGTWPFLLRSLHGAAFVDAGAAWTDRLTTRSRRASAGLEISADVVIGYVMPLTLTSGIAWRYDPTRTARGAALYARVGRAF